MTIGAAPPRRGARDGFRWSPAGVFVGSLALTLAATLAVAASTRARDQARFEAAVAHTRGRMEARLETYLFMLRGLAALYAARAPDEPSELAAHMEKLELEPPYAGVQGLGFSALRTTGEAEPIDRRRLDALGRDTATEAVHRDAMERARDTGSPARSGRIMLERELDDPQGGFSIYVPVYAGGRVPPSLGERRTLLVGYVYSPIRVEGFFRAALAVASADGVGCAVYDGEQVEPGALLYGSHDETTERAFRRIERLAIGGRPLTLAFFSTAAFSLWGGLGLAVAVLALGLAGGTALSLSVRCAGRAWAEADESRRDAASHRQRLHALMTEASAATAAIESPAHATAPVQAGRCEERLAELQFERDRLAAILRAVSDGVAVQDKSGRLVFANAAAARLCGFAEAREMLESPPEQILERFEVLDEQGRPFPPARLPGRLVLEGKEAEEVVLRVRHKHTGQNFYSIVTAGPVYGPSGEVELAINVFRDITERKNTEDWWHFLADATAVLSSSLDYEITLERVAQMAVPRLGDWCAVDMAADASGSVRRLAVAHVDPAKVALARRIQERYPPDLDSPRGLARVLRTGEPELYPEIPDELLVASARDPEHLRLSRELGLKSAILVPLKVGERVLGVITIVAAESNYRYGAVDLASAIELARRAALAVENARLYREAQAAVRRRDEFLSVASHELKTPLSSVHLQVQSLLRLAARAGSREFPSDKLAAKLLRADTQLGKLTALINQLLDVTHIVSGQFMMQPRPTNFAAVVREVTARLESAAEAAGSPFDLSLAPSVLGNWDPDRLEQLVTNLLSNALKYGAGQPVEITLQRSGRDALLVVRDRGPGIEVADQARIFERFERASPMRHYAGLGLGLWIARQIVLAHSGEIGVESAPGKGASFTVRLPATDVAASELAGT